MSIKYKNNGNYMHLIQHYVENNAFFAAVCFYFKERTGWK